VSVAHPKTTHVLYSDLPKDQRQEIRRLAALLRVADGLDRGQVGRVADLAVRSVDEHSVELDVLAPRPCPEELYGGEKKSDLLRAVFGRELRLRHVSCTGGAHASRL